MNFRSRFVGDMRVGQFNPIGPIFAHPLGRMEYPVCPTCQKIELARAITEASSSEQSCVTRSDKQPSGGPKLDPSTQPPILYNPRKQAHTQRHPGTRSAMTFIPLERAVRHKRWAVCMRKHICLHEIGIRVLRVSLLHPDVEPLETCWLNEKREPF